MIVFDAHLDLAWNAIDWNRDLRLPVADIRRSEQGLTDKGRGVIRDASIHDRILEELRQFTAAQANLNWRGVVESPLQGPAGNKEFLVLIEKL